MSTRRIRSVVPSVRGPCGSSRSSSNPKSSTCLCRARQTGKILTHLGLWPAVHSPPPRYPWPYPLQRVSLPHNQLAIIRWPRRGRAPRAGLPSARGVLHTRQQSLISSIASSWQPCPVRRIFPGIRARGLTWTAGADLGHRGGSRRGAKWAGVPIVARAPRANSYHLY
jgi:hypothetical protein